MEETDKYLEQYSKMSLDEIVKDVYLDICNAGSDITEQDRISKIQQIKDEFKNEIIDVCATALLNIGKVYLKIE